MNGFEGEEAVRLREAEHQIGVLRTLLEQRERYYGDERRRLMAHLRDLEGRGRFSEARITALAASLSASRPMKMADRIRAAIRLFFPAMPFAVRNIPLESKSVLSPAQQIKKAA